MTNRRAGTLSLIYVRVNTSSVSQVRSAAYSFKLVASEDLPNPEDQWRPLIRKGQTYYVLHYLGEGAWLVWFRGKLTTVENPLQRGPFPKAVWWVKVKTSAGVVGWAISDGNFDGQCSIAQRGSPTNRGIASAPLDAQHSRRPTNSRLF